MLTAPANASNTTFKITDAKLYASLVTLSAEDNVKLIKQLNEGFNRSIYWNKCKAIDNKEVDFPAANEEKHIRELFVLVYDNTVGDNKVSVDCFKTYFLPRVKIENNNIEIDGRNFFDQPINGWIKQYDEIRKNINRTRW